MKNNKILLILVVVLAAVAVYIFTTKTSGTLGSNKEEKSDFAVKDTASIDKIFIVDAKGQSVTLTKGEKDWLVDGRYIARPDNIRLLMKTFARIDVRSPVPKSAFNNVVKAIATSGTKVEIYQGEDKPSKIYYIGGPTIDHQGTYMILETEGVKSSVPFIMYIPGNYAYLTTRFFTNAQQWRDAIVFKHLPEEIESIEINYFETPEESFKLSKNGEGYTLSAKTNMVEIPNVNAAKVKEYVARYQKIYYEMIDEESSQEKIDSIIASPPFLSIEVKTTTGEINKIVTYHMPNFRKVTDPATEIEFPYDIDRMYAHLNGELFLFVQFATFDNITYPRSYFLDK